MSSERFSRRKFGAALGAIGFVGFGWSGYIVREATEDQTRIDEQVENLEHWGPKIYTEDPVTHKENTYAEQNIDTRLQVGTIGAVTSGVIFLTGSSLLREQKSQQNPKPKTLLTRRQLLFNK